MDAGGKFAAGIVQANPTEKDLPESAPGVFYHFYIRKKSSFYK